MIPRVASLRGIKNLTTLPKDYHVKSKSEFEEVEYASNGNEVPCDQKIRMNPSLRNQEENSKSQWNRPEKYGVQLKQLLKCRDIIFKIPGKTSGNFNSGRNEEPPDPAYTADEDMARKESNQRA